MNWRVGLLRLWMVVTAIWFVIMVSLEWLNYPYGFTTFYNLLDWARDKLPGLAGVLFVPPLARRLGQRSYTGHSPLWIVASGDQRRGDAVQESPAPPPRKVIGSSQR